MVLDFAEVEKKTQHELFRIMLIQTIIVGLFFVFVIVSFFSFKTLQSHSYQLVLMLIISEFLGNVA